MAPLKGLNVLEFCQRLPGPLAGYLLAEEGATVVKIEDENRRDPFEEGEFFELDHRYRDLYQTLNKKKKIYRTPMKIGVDQEENKKLIEKADIIIVGLPAKIKSVWQLDKLELLQGKVVIELAASPDGPAALHDLNVMGMIGALIGKKDPTLLSNEGTVLPMAGISYGQDLAFKALAHLYKAKNQKSTEVFAWSLLESVERNLGPFTRTVNPPLLHEGKIPCYHLYKSKDEQWFALAAVEERFWLKFCEIFELKLNLEDRFKAQPQIFKTISDRFQNLTAEEIKSKLGTEDICLTLIP